MKTLFIFFIACFFYYSCAKQDLSLPTNVEVEQPSISEYVKYVIRKGQHYSDSNKVVRVEYEELKFLCKFDSSAIYTTADPANQYDINKLYGFSDNMDDHQDFSARFGWRWSDDALRIFSYVYNGGIKTSKELGTVEIGAENTCSIKVTNGGYIFSLNNSVDTVDRQSTTAKGTGYKLYPYFGGDETAPHEIHIEIKEAQGDRLSP